jgi:hypothetical protein
LQVGQIMTHTNAICSSFSFEEGGGASTNSPVKS